MSGRAKQIYIKAAHTLKEIHNYCPLFKALCEIEIAQIAKGKQKGQKSLFQVF
jgi:hypothetical protein